MFADGQHILPEQRQLSREFVELVKPLARVSSTAELESLLAAIALQFAELKSKYLQSLTTATGQGISVREASRLVFEGIEARLPVKANLFGEGVLEQFVGALGSLRAFTQHNLDALEEGELGIHKILPVLQVVGRETLYADIIVSALQLIIFDAIRDWAVESIHVLVQKLDDVMVEIEDFFLSRQSLDDHEHSELVDMETVRAELGL